MSTSDFGSLRHAIGELQHAVSELRAAYGGVSGVRRLENDLERLEIDAGEFAESRPSPMRGRANDEVIYVPPASDNEAAWMGAQDEGLGFHSRSRTR